MVLLFWRMYQFKKNVFLCCQLSTSTIQSINQCMAYVRPSGGQRESSGSRSSRRGENKCEGKTTRPQPLLNETIFKANKGRRPSKRASTNKYDYNKQRREIERVETCTIDKE